MASPLSGFVQKEVSRKEFLGLLGLATLSIFGFGVILKLVTGKSLDSHPVLHDYSGAAYGSVSVVNKHTTGL
jgi:hypothetical protein